MKTIELERGIKKTFNSITLDMLREPMGERAKQTKQTAQLRQVVTTTYPATSFGNEFQDALGSAPEGQSFDENRIAFVDVPKNVTEEQVQAMIDELEDAVIYKILTSDYSEVLTSNQLNWGANMIESDEEKEEYFETLRNNLLVKNSDSEAIDRKGNVIDNPAQDNPRCQYKATFFSKTWRDDVDNRLSEAEIEAAVSSEEQPESITAPASTPAGIEEGAHVPADQ